METVPLMRFKSHIDGRNAEVSVFRDRIEWWRKGRVTATRVVSGAALVGKARKPGDAEMIPVRTMTSVVVKRTGMWSSVQIICGGNTVDFRTTKQIAESVKSLLTSLIISGEPPPYMVQFQHHQQAYPQQHQSHVAVPAVAPMPGPGAPQSVGQMPPPPPSPAGWKDDPTGRHEHRYWDGAAWTSNVSDKGHASTNPL